MSMLTTGFGGCLSPPSLVFRWCSYCC